MFSIGYAPTFASFNIVAVYQTCHVDKFADAAAYIVDIFNFIRFFCSRTTYTTYKMSHFFFG